MDGLKPSKLLQGSSNKPRGRDAPQKRGGGRGRGADRGPESSERGRGGGRGGDRGRGRGGKGKYVEDVSDVGMALNGKLPPNGFKTPQAPDVITFGQTPSVFRKLISQGASALTDDSIGLRLAAKVGNLTAVKLYVEAGANPAANNNEAIYWAAENGYDDIVAYLMQQPNTNPADSNNRALTVAKKYKHKYVISILETDARVTGNTDAEFEALDILYPLESGGAYSTVTFEGRVVRKRVTSTERDDGNLVQAAADEAAMIERAREAWPYVPEVIAVEGDTIVMSRVPGESYQYLLLSGFNQDVLRAAVLEAVIALATAGIQHHDLSLTNIYYHKGKAWILDFGLATLEEDTSEIVENDMKIYDVVSYEEFHEEVYPYD